VGSKEKLMVSLNWINENHFTSVSKNKGMWQKHIYNNIEAKEILTNECTFK